MDNMKIYNESKNVPKEALKPILGGRLKGMSDINPMWRIKKLTELFGVCGIGWKIEVTRNEIINGHGDERVCFVDINLYIKNEGEWSYPIPGSGGSAFTTTEKNGVYTSDECYKMALTDAISVACKFLGFAADVYYEKDRSKYTNDGETENKPSTQENTSNDEKQIKKEIQAKYIKIHGDDKGLADYVKSQLDKKYNYKQINAYLGKQLTNK